MQDQKELECRVPVRACMALVPFENMKDEGTEASDIPLCSAVNFL